MGMGRGDGAYWAYRAYWTYRGYRSYRALLAAVKEKIGLKSWIIKGLCITLHSFFNLNVKHMGKFTQFKLALRALSPGENRFVYHLDKEFFVNMESQDIHNADITVDLTVNYHNDVYDLDFAVKGTIVLLCDRCLDEMDWDVDETYHVMVKYGETYNDDSDEVLEIPESDNYLNVAYMIYDTVSLAIPMKHVHPAGKCNRQMSAVLKRHRVEDGEATVDDVLDIVDEIGETDPRWDALRDLDLKD